MFTARVTEQIRPVARINPASYSSAQETSRVKVTQYNRFLAELALGAITGSGTVDMKIRQHNAASGGTSKDVSGKALTQLTGAGSDSNKKAAIELRTEELDGNNGFDWISVLVTPAVAASILGVTLWGASPKDLPIGTTEWDEVVD